MRELRESDRNDRDGQHGVAERPEVGERLLEHVAVVEPGHDHHLAVELNPALGEPRQLLDDVRHARIVEQHLARFPRRRVHRDVERRQPVLEDARDVALLHVRERREVAVGERQPIVVVANVERLAQALRQPLDEAELAAVRAAANRGRLELDAQRLAFRPLDLVDDRFAVGQRGFDDELVVGGQKFPVEEVGELAPVDRQQLGARHDSQLLRDAGREDGLHANHLTHHSDGMDAWRRHPARIPISFLASALRTFARNSAIQVVAANSRP